MEKRWADLPLELLLYIFNSVTLTVLDVIHISAVCTSWKSAANISKHHKNFRHQSPWLMFVGKEDPKSAQLYNFSDDKVNMIPDQPDLPVANRIFIGSAHGWLITADEKSELSLLNPITRQQIELPPVSTFENVCPFPPDSEKQLHYYIIQNQHGHTVHYTVEHLRHTFYKKAALSSSPTAGDYVVALLLREPHGFAFARAGDEKWTMTFIDNSNAINDITFLDDGKELYTTNWRGSIEAWNLNKKDPTSIKPELVCHKPLLPINMRYFYYLVCTPCSELLLVRRDGDFGGDYMTTRRIRTWKIRLDKNEKSSKLKSLKDYAIFLSDRVSTCVSSKDIP